MNENPRNKVRIRINLEKADPKLFSRLSELAYERGITVSRLCEDIVAAAVEKDFCIQKV